MGALLESGHREPCKGCGVQVASCQAGSGRRRLTPEQSRWTWVAYSLTTSRSVQASDAREGSQQKKRPWQKLFRHRFVAIVHAVSSARSARTLHRHKQKTNFTSLCSSTVLACRGRGGAALTVAEEGSGKREAEERKCKVGGLERQTKKRAELPICHHSHGSFPLYFVHGLP